MRADPPLVVAQTRMALKRAAGGSETARVGLVVIVDQMETLFAAPAIYAAARAGFDRLIAALAASGAAMVLATLRSDFYPRLVELPELAALSRGDGQYQLAPPTPAELELIVRRPAESAGLAFETDSRSGVGLDADDPRSGGARSRLAAAAVVRTRRALPPRRRRTRRRPADLRRLRGAGGPRKAPSLAMPRR